ncbi:hypothetical protein, partial [Paraburkholderia solisilvae]|uniref:hypothetical protein n=1 Tax=Paraburkholderia solisilvae TaxID=624376 RepID=UPI0015821A23
VEAAAVAAGVAAALGVAARGASVSMSAAIPHRNLAIDSLRIEIIEMARLCRVGFDLIKVKTTV